jgi:predicted methyltransferase
MDFFRWFIAFAVAAVACSKPPPPADPDDVEQQFKTPEDWSKVFDDPQRDAWQKPDEVMKLLAVGPGMTVVDIGAGTGYFARTLSRAVGPTGRVIATDVDPAMIRFLSQRIEREALTNVTPTLTQPSETGLPAGAVDRALIVDTWHYIEDRPDFARRLATALAPGGVVAVSGFNLDSRRSQPGHHGLPPADVVADLASAGFDAAVVAEDLPEQYVVKATLARP